MTKLVRDLELAARLRSATSGGETVVEGGGDRFLVIRVPPAVEVTDPEEIEVALAAAAEYLGPRYRADEVLALLRREVAGEHRAT